MVPWPKVSVTIITYNQKRYISQAIDSVLAQSYPGELEIIIRDDCSNDGTAQLVKEYEAAYNNIIAICLTKNTYRLGVEPMSAVMKHATGDYIFLLEGDDYWTDHLKIQKITGLMVKYSIGLCFHKSCGIDASGNFIDDIASHGKYLKLFDLKDVILGGPPFMSISGVALKKSVFELFPAWFYNGLPFGDYFIQVLASKDNGALYFPEVMSVYRINAEGSWTSNQRRLELDQILCDYQLIKSAFRNLENELDEKYSRFLQKMASKECLNHAIRAANNGHFRLSCNIVAENIFTYPFVTPVHKLTTLLKVLAKKILDVFN